MHNKILCQSISKVLATIATSYFFTYGAVNNENNIFAYLYSEFQNVFFAKYIYECLMRNLNRRKIFC